MGISKKVYDYDKLGELTDAGISIADFPQIRDAITRRMQEIYGNDIDVSDASADGQYINMESLILNNIYQLLNNLYNGFNPAIATGKYLDILCSLSNIYRKSQSYSRAQLALHATVANKTLSKNTIFTDRNNIQWKYIGDDMTLNTGNTLYDIVEVVCESIGSISAAKSPIDYEDYTASDWNDLDPTEDDNGVIYLCSDSQIKVIQATDAVVGDERETDTSLRARRYNFLGSNAITTLSGLYADLYGLAPIKDVYVYSNNSSSSKTVGNSDQSVGAHDVFVVTRYKDNIADSTELNNLIGETIYNQLTPGVCTTQYTGTTGSAKSASFKPEYALEATIVKWKKATPVHPKIEIEFSATGEYVTSTQSLIMQSIINYTDKIKLTEDLTPVGLQTAVLSADPKPSGIATLFPTSCAITGAGSDGRYSNKLTYFDYKYGLAAAGGDFTFEAPGGTHANTWKITIQRSA